MTKTNNQYKNITIKIGTNSLLSNNSLFNYTLIEQTARTIKQYSNQENEDNQGISYRFSIVSSGAIELGNVKLGLEKSDNLQMSQVSAGVGNKILFRKYDEIFQDYGLETVPLLVSADDFKNNKKRETFQNAMFGFKKLNIIPIINENDTFQTDEIKFGDNDALGAIMGNETNSEKLLILSNIDGLYSNIKNRTVIPTIQDLYRAKKHISTEISTGGTGGMLSKLFAASIFQKQLILANGDTNKILERILENELLGTRFDISDKQKKQFIHEYTNNQNLSIDLKSYLLENI